jgi:murein DD-endopeptidase MepM/ murein hydrolase activator NlpD
MIVGLRLRKLPKYLKVNGLTLVGVLAVPTALAAQTTASASALPSKTPIIDELRAKSLLLPVPGVAAQSLKDSFRDARDGNRIHYAVDIVAPRGTPVLSTDSGRILKLYESQAGGLMIYVADSSERFIYYYAHLDRYHTGIAEGRPIARGDTIGYVGTTGNAPPDYPHLHFAILRSFDLSRWSRGVPVNPTKVF